MVYVPDPAWLPYTQYGWVFNWTGTGLEIECEASSPVNQQNSYPVGGWVSGGTTVINPIPCSEGDNISLYDANGNLSVQFTVPTFNKSSSSGGGGGGGFLSTEDPRFTGVSFTKTEDDHVTLEFDFDEMDGTLSNYVVHKKAADGTETNSSDQGISGSSGTITRTGTHIPILDGLAEGDQLWIEHSSNPIHIVYDNDGYGGIDNPYVHNLVDWSIETVNGQKSVVARFFGVDTGLSFDHAITTIGPNGNTQNPIVWDGTLQTVVSPYRANTTYSIQRNAGNTAPLYGARFKTKSGKVFSTFW